MENRDKAVSLFKYIKELYGQRHQIVHNVKGQKWVKFISDIPNDEKNITLHYADIVELPLNGKGGDDVDITVTQEPRQTILLEVHKPEFEPCPQPAESLLPWLEDCWPRFNKPLIKKESIVFFENGQRLEYSFAESMQRVKDYNAFAHERGLWVERQKKVDATRSFFNELHLKHIELERDSETLELMVGQGMLECGMNAEKGADRVYHPVMLKKISTQFDAVNNVIRILDSDLDPEIYTMMLQSIEFINHAAVKTAQEELTTSYYHPLDRTKTPDFLRSLAHMLSVESRYADSADEGFDSEDTLVIHDKPVFFIRKKTGGVIKAIEGIIDHIEETGEIYGPLLELIDKEALRNNNIPKESERGGIAIDRNETSEILFSKESNQEQNDVARRIENYNAVLVQGPPGTGKTHTIANLVGHFLAQGKSVLVTSYTRKALSVLKEKVVPELRHLCVSILDDDNADMERSIDRITEFISAHSASELRENTNKLKQIRQKIQKDLDGVRNKIVSIKNKEFEPIFFDGVSYTPAQAAQFVEQNKETLSYIPGYVSLRNTLPLTLDELKTLYKSNRLITPEEERELANDLPDPEELLNASDFSLLMDHQVEVETKIRNLEKRFPEPLEINFKEHRVLSHGKEVCRDINVKALANLRERLKELVFGIDKDGMEEWCYYAVLDGKKGNGFKMAWEKLIQNINEAYHYSSKKASLLSGKHVTGNLPVTVRTVKMLLDMKDYLSKGKKLTSFAFLFNSKEWLELYNNIRIDGKNIETQEDCIALISYCKLDIARQNMSQLWSELIARRGGAAIEQFGDEPEKVSINYIPKIKECLGWYNCEFQEIKNLSVEAGINPDVLVEDKEYTSPLEEINSILSLIYRKIPVCADLVGKVYVDLPRIDKKFDSMAEALSNGKTQDSNICRKLSEAIADKNRIRYRHYFELFSTLCTKSSQVKERHNLLKKLGNVAPDWAEVIKNRTGIHGFSRVPENVEEAWRWKQFSGIIDEITTMPFDGLQRRAIELSDELQNTTTKLAQHSAWYHLLCRLEKDMSQRQALQGWKLTVKKIGKGTGKTSPRLKREAQKLMAQCQTAVPAWIMPVNKALESLEPKTNKFDVVIVDEASQSDISALPLIYLAKKTIIVGDDEQVSPSAVGIDADKMANLSSMYIKDSVPNAHLYDMRSSLYDIAKTTFPTLMLKEHFRCVPAIIGYSNQLCYENRIRPLRDDSMLSTKPATIAYHVDSGLRSSTKTNDREAKTIVALMLSCMEYKEYDGMNFGAISLLGDEQATRINEIAVEKIPPLDFHKRQILCGSARQFQGDERDIIFISLVDSNDDIGHLKIVNEGVDRSTKQRYNVATSRARNQLWVVHSFDVKRDLKPGDMRRNLIEYVTNPAVFQNNPKSLASGVGSLFEKSVAKALTLRGYHVIQQYPVGGYNIDMVARYGENHIAIECDGELYYNGEGRILQDLERQATLERLGWRFIRVRSSEYYRSPAETINVVVQQLSDYGIEPESSTAGIHEMPSILTESVIIRAEQILNSWSHEPQLNLPKPLIIDNQRRLTSS